MDSISVEVGLKLPLARLQRLHRRRPLGLHRLEREISRAWASCRRPSTVPLPCALSAAICRCMAMTRWRSSCAHAPRRAALAPAPAPGCSTLTAASGDRPRRPRELAVHRRKPASAGVPHVDLADLGPRRVHPVGGRSRAGQHAQIALLERDPLLVGLGQRLAGFGDLLIEESDALLGLVTAAGDVLLLENRAASA